MSDPYDPQEVDEKRRGSQYVSRKDFRIVAVVLFVLAIFAWPVYMFMLRGVNSSLCAKNLRKISGALQNYIADFDDHLPYAYETVDYDSKDVHLRGGYAYTWQWQLERYTNDWSAFRCPAADKSENTLTSDGTDIEATSYGMLNAYSGVQMSTIPNPDQKILIGETAKSGANGTADPLPLMAGGNVLKDDGFVIGFDNDQDYPNSKTSYATRLAFPGSAKTGFNHETETRHPAENHFLSLTGAMRSMDGSIGSVIRLGDSFGPWDVPKPIPAFSPTPPSQAKPPSRASGR
ncbi:MAG TPA: hypothetical protein VHE55_15880 [Fimbriimonadaceae bacterium]|nr:hypothetical protein [Fimbriimonadaceae bacterium]